MVMKPELLCIEQMFKLKSSNYYHMRQSEILSHTHIVEHL